MEELLKTKYSTISIFTSQTPAWAVTSFSPVSCRQSLRSSVGWPPRGQPTFARADDAPWTRETEIFSSFDIPSRTSGVGRHAFVHGGAQASTCPTWRQTFRTQSSVPKSADRARRCTPCHRMGRGSCGYGSDTGWPASAGPTGPDVGGARAREDPRYMVREVWRHCLDGRIMERSLDQTNERSVERVTNPEESHASEISGVVLLPHGRESVRDLASGPRNN
ncbi:hypothetical protein K3495_g2180 [Podosphaera aphanis]|nr:hypothetical protein K3495_g2180 [Podosphaera aphanis]